MKREEALEAVEPLFEPCLRALHFAPAEKPSLEVLRDMSSVHENGLRAAIALAYQAGYEQREVDDKAENAGWNEAIDWLLNSRYTAEPEIQAAFWMLSDGKCTRDEAEDGFMADGRGIIEARNIWEKD